MPFALPHDVVDALERLGAASTGDIPALITAARGVAPGPFDDDALLARALELAASKRAAAVDRYGAWWLACAVATLRASAVASPQEDAEVLAARLLGELPHSPAARAPLPAVAQWVVGGVAEPAPAAITIELARLNSSTYLVRLDAELSSRATALRAHLEAAEAARGESARSEVEEILRSYEAAGWSARASISRAVDHVGARSADGGLVDAGRAALESIDDGALARIRERIAQARAWMSAEAAPAPSVRAPGDAPASFVGEPPPSFRRGAAPTPAPIAPDAQPPSGMSGGRSRGAGATSAAQRDALDRAMRAAFERAWSAPAPASHAAFEHAVRARYELETASIPDPLERQNALDHYIAHALAQLPPL